MDLWYFLKFITLLLEPFYAFRQCRMKFVNALQGIMECNDGTISGKAFYVVDNIIGREEL